MFQHRCTICLLVVICSLASIANGLNLHVGAITETAATSQSKNAADTGPAAAAALLRRQLEGKSDSLQVVSASPDSTKGEQAEESIVAEAASTNQTPTSPPTNNEDTAAAATTKAASTEEGTNTAATETEITTPPSAEKEEGTDELSAICSDATTCDACKNAAQSVETKTKETSTCVFKADDNAADAATIGCQLIPKKKASTTIAGMCLPQKDDSDGGGFSFVVGLFVLTVVSVAYHRFKKGKLRFGGDGIVNDFASVMSGTRAPYHKTETAPLATTSADDDEEWGWEDSTHNDLGHLEMSNKKDDEDLTKAFAMSTKGLSHAPPKSSPVFSRAPPVATTSTSSSNSGPSASMSSFTPPAMQITSLGLPTSSSTMPKKKQIKKQEDDLFASMGLAAKPTFSTTASSSAATKAPPSSKSSDLVATDLMSVDAKWDDDGDLDDLLDD